MSITIPPEEFSNYLNSTSSNDTAQTKNPGPCEEHLDKFWFKEEDTKLEDPIEMWSDLWDMKAQLLERGVVFGDANQRLSDGDASNSTHQLCNEYDELREHCFQTLNHPRSVYEDNYPKNGQRKSTEEDPGLSDGGESSLCDTEIDSRRSFDVASRLRAARKTGVPQNIGWRFSDDFEPVFESISWQLQKNTESIVQLKATKKHSVESTVQVLEGYLEKEEEKERKDSSLKRSTSKSYSIYPASFGAFKLELLTIAAFPSPPKRPRSPEPTVPRQRPRLKIDTDVPNMLMFEDLMNDPRGSQGQMSTSVIAPFTEHSIVNHIPLDKQMDKKLSRKSSLRKWVRQTFRRR